MCGEFTNLIHDTKTHVIFHDFCVDFAKVYRFWRRGPTKGDQSRPEKSPLKGTSRGYQTRADQRQQATRDDHSRPEPSRETTGDQRRPQEARDNQRNQRQPETSTGCQRPPEKSKGDQRRGRQAEVSRDFAGRVWQTLWQESFAQDFASNLGGNWHELLQSSQEQRATTSSQRTARSRHIGTRT